MLDFFHGTTSSPISAIVDTVAMPVTSSMWDATKPPKDAMENASTALSIIVQTQHHRTKKTKHTQKP